MKNMILSKAIQKYGKTVSVLKKGYEQEKFRIGAISNSFLGEMVVRNVTSVDIATFRDQRLALISPRTKKKLSNATVRLEMSLLSSFFDLCRIEWGFCEHNPVSNVRKPKPEPGRERRLTARESKQILRYAYSHSNKELYSIVVIALETAMRQGEILALKWEHINLRTRVAHLPSTKNGTKRDVPLSFKARDALIRLGVQSKGKVFSYTSSGLKSTWRFMRISLGIEDLHFHDLRHEAISRLFELGSLDLMEIAAISGHKSLAMLKKYTHLKAQKLVKKLEGGKHKGKLYLFENLIPYPGHLRKMEQGGFELSLLDFEELSVSGRCLDSTIKNAQDLLMRKILNMIKNSEPIPQPDQYLHIIDEINLVMIDPLGADSALI